MQTWVVSIDKPPSTLGLRLIETETGDPMAACYMSAGVERIADDLHMAIELGILTFTNVHRREGLALSAPPTASS